MEFTYDVNGTVRRLTVEEKDGVYAVRDGDRRYTADIRRTSEGTLTMLVGGRAYAVLIARDRNRRIVRVNGREHVVREPDETPGGGSDNAGRAADGGLKIKPPMPGKVIKVQVSVGEAVRKNQTLVIVEAMKMENEIRSAIEGVVTKILVAVGDLVDPERPMIELEAKCSDKGSNHV
jgi:biotin carboxyl carrier protein